MRHLESNRAVEVGDVRLCFLQNKATGARRAVLPPDVKSVCTLIFGFDEGSIGSAGVAAAAFQQKTTVWARFDSIDRVIRDLKFVERMLRLGVRENQIVVRVSLRPELPMFCVRREPHHE